MTKLLLRKLRLLSVILLFPAFFVMCTAANSQNDDFVPIFNAQDLIRMDYSGR
jgi:hypothetical protein